MEKLSKGPFGIRCFILLITFIIVSNILCVQFVNAELGHPQLTISSVITPNTIERGSTGTLTVVVSEISGNDWAKDVTVQPSISSPQGCSITPSSKYIAKINKLGSATFTFNINVPSTASVGSASGVINGQYSETGTLDIGVFGPYAFSNTFSFTINKGTGTVYITSTPSNANIKIDGLLSGVTPQTASSVLEGTHTISFSKSGYQDYSTTFTVYPGQTTTVSGNLNPIPIVQPPTTAQSVYLQPASSSSGGSSNSSGFIILLFIGIIVIVAGYVGYSKFRSREEKPLLDTVTSSQKEMMPESLPRTQSTYPTFEADYRKKENLVEPIKETETDSDQDIKVYEEKQARIEQVNKFRERVKLLNEEAEKVGLVPDFIKNNLQDQDIEILERTITDLDSFITNAKPELTLSLDRTQLSTERWHKLGITLTNTGLAHVENVTFTFSNEFETKGIKPISVQAGQSSRTDISIIPKNVGNILLEITLKYRDHKGREYTKVQEFWIDVIEKGTTTSPPSETPSSPVGQFTPKPLTPRQLPPDLSDHYTESEFIGKGGFARVFKAKRKDGKFVAVKIPISMDATTGKSFIAEMQNWTKLSHPNIVRLYEFNIMPMPYFEEELCDSALAELQKPLECEEAAWILFNVCEGLKFAHAHKIIHRDLKPQNILLKNGEPKISDWGLSRIISESTSTTATSFTPYYAAPEQINNKIKDERTDIWQIGVILYEFITGEMPFKGESMIEIGMNIATKDPKPPGEINPGAKALDSVVMKCLQKNPAQRHQSILELQKDLGMYLRENYTELLKTSVTANNFNQSAYFCGDLVMINLLTGDISTAYKYLLDLVHYSKGDVKVEAQELSEQIKYRMEMGVTEIPDELVQKAEIIVHKVSIGFRKM